MKAWKEARAAACRKSRAKKKGKIENSEEIEKNEENGPEEIPEQILEKPASEPSDQAETVEKTPVDKTEEVSVIEGPKEMKYSLKGSPYTMAENTDKKVMADFILGMADKMTVL